MPTPVSSVRQCLTEDAAAALDDAVAVARRRSHAQTTSLHAVSALLALPSSLREACARARNPMCLPRLQFRALELSVGVSLDRLPSSKTVDDPPPVSNSLMAAIKRSQAMQKRHPDSFPPQNQATSLSGIKVELKHFILSILDDPVVSKVLGEAGFRSYDIKLAILNPPSPPQFFSRSRCPPTHLLPAGGGYPAFHFVGGVEEDCRRIREIMMKKKGRNPMLIGPSAGDALSGFLTTVENGGLASPIDGLKVVCLKKDIFQFASEGSSMKEEKLDLKFEELGGMVQRCSSGPGGGVLVSIGELAVLMGEGDGGDGDGLGYAVSKLSGLLGGGHSESLWLIAAADNHQTYSKFQSRFPSIETEWDLQLLPITSFRSSSSSARGCYYPKSSLMGSFVPFGGFFSMPSDIGSPFGKAVESRSPHPTIENYDQRIPGDLKSGNPISDVSLSGFSSWLQMVEPGADNGISIKKNDDTTKSPAEMVARAEKNPLLGFSMDQSAMVQPPSSEAMCTVSGRSVFPDMTTTKSSSKIAETGDFPFPHTPHFGHFFPFPSARPPVSGVPVTTELQLGTMSASAASSSCGNQWQCHTDPKSLWRQLVDMVGRQEEALRVISETICLSANGGSSSSSSPRGGVWICLLGPDRPAKKSIASALAEVVFSSRHRFLSVNLDSRHGIRRSNSETGGVLNQASRGKTTVDYIAEELKNCRNSVIFFENADQGDLLVQNNLSHAARTGKFPDSHGREVDIRDFIFVMAMNTAAGTTEATRGCEFTEEGISQAEFRHLQIAVEDGVNNGRRKRKRAGSELDLNLPVPEEEEEGMGEDENYKKWVKILADEADVAVVLEKVDLDGMAEDIWREIEKTFGKKMGGRGAMVEVSEGAMGQMVAAAWRTQEGKRGVKEWIGSVLSGSFEEAGRKYSACSGYIFRLVQGGELLFREEGDERGRCLPQCIPLN